MQLSQVRKILLMLLHIPDVHLKLSQERLKLSGQTLSEKVVCQSVMSGVRVKNVCFRAGMIRCHAYESTRSAFECLHRTCHVVS